MAKAPQSEAVTFHSMYPKLRVVVRAIHTSIVDGHRVNTPGKVAEFDRGTFTTTDSEIIDYLRNHGTYGMDYFDTEEALAAATTTVDRGITADDRPEVAVPTRTRPGQRAAVKAKPTTAADLDEGSTLADDEDEV